MEPQHAIRQKVVFQPFCLSANPDFPTLKFSAQFHASRLNIQLKK